MADFYGPLALPVPAPAAGATFADPAIDTLLSFFQAVLNANGGAAWSAVNDYQAGGDNVVNTVNAFDPEEDGGLTFNARDLPALFMWRSAILGSVWKAADYYVRYSQITLLWVPPAAVQSNRAIWHSATNLIASILDGITDPDGRDPSWVQPGDTDPAAAYQGSLLWKYLPNMWEFSVNKTERARVKISIDGEVASYACVKVVIDFAEQNVTVDPVFKLKGIDLTVGNPGTTGDASPLDLTVPLNLALVSLSPSSGPRAGGTLVTILGIGFDSGAKAYFGSIPGSGSTPLDPIGEIDPKGYAIPDFTTLQVTTPGTSLTGTLNITVVNSNGDSATLASSFTYV